MPASTTPGQHAPLVKGAGDRAQGNLAIVADVCDDRCQGQGMPIRIGRVPEVPDARN